MTCLSLVNSVLARVGLPQTNAVVTSPDQKVQQVLAFVNEEGQELAARHQWAEMVGEFTFITVAATNQFAMIAKFGSNAAPPSSQETTHIINNTIWNQSQRLPVYGVLSPQEWEMLQAQQISGPYSRFGIFDGSFKMIPIPPAGQTCYGQMWTQAWVSSLAAGTATAEGSSLGSTYFSDDAQFAKISEQLIALGAIWRWKAAKGLPYAEDFAKYERRAITEMSRNTPKPTLNMGGSFQGIQPVVMVAAGSWMS